MQKGEFLKSTTSVRGRWYILEWEIGQAKSGGHIFARMRDQVVYSYAIYLGG